MNIKKTLQKAQKPYVPIKEGDRVKLNVSRIRNHPDWDKYLQKYKDWVNTHSRNYFTVEYVPMLKEGKNLMVCLKEDDSDPKWLFFTGDLTKLTKKERKENEKS